MQRDVEENKQDLEAAQQMVAEMRATIEAELKQQSKCAHSEDCNAYDSFELHDAACTCGLTKSITRLSAALSASAPIAGQWVPRERCQSAIRTAELANETCSEALKQRDRLTAELEQSRRERDEIENALLYDGEEPMTEYVKGIVPQLNELRAANERLTAECEMLRGGIRSVVHSIRTQQLANEVVIAERLAALTQTDAAQEKLWCAMCGTWGDHRSGGCPELKAAQHRVNTPVD